MRRILATLGILGTFTAGVYWLKDRVSFAPKIGTPVEMHQEVATAPNTQKKFTTTTKGEKHENSAKRSRSTKVQGPRSGENERASDELDEIESLASIYQDQEAQPAQSKRSSVTEPEEVLKDSNSQAASRSPIPGVKVAAWVSSQKNVVPHEVPDPGTGTGMRYFLNCMELKKKGLSPLNAKDCDALIADRRLKN